ncbi:MAG: 5'-nucleotidase C-terminal domain-containing protein [Bdellovibrionales bacterium]|nr:5'-nucleotidase C-terminal domain-containing protein [Bdellovibrionales bacterium]
MTFTPRARFRFAFFALLAIVLNACSTSPKFQAGKRTENLSDTTGDEQTIVIMGLNDFHGALLPLEMRSKESDEKQRVNYRAGGAAMLASYVDILRGTFGPNFFILDAGDEFQGTLESNASEGKPIVEFFNRIGVSAAAVGNHEFDFGPEGDVPVGAPGSDLRGALKARMKEAKYPYLSANMSYRDGRPLDFPNLYPSVMLQAGRLKVGVVGLSTVMTPVTTRPEFVKDLQFSAGAEATLRESKKLRAQGAHLVVVVAHAGLRCERRRPEPGLLRRPGDNEGACDPDEEITEMIEALPTGTVDAVISGHTHTVVHHFVRGIPVIQAGASGQYFNLVYLTWNWKEKRLVTSEMAIEGPVPICEKVFDGQGDCNGVRTAPRTGRGKLSTPKFHGATMKPSSSISKWLVGVDHEVTQLKKKVVGTASRPLEHVRERESPLGNLITDAMREAMKADIAITNPGGIRSSIDSGPIQYEDVFRAFPFDNDIRVVEMNEDEIRLMLRVAQSGARGYFPVSGLKLTLLHPHVSAEGTDLNGNKKIDPWEMNRLVAVTLPDGTPLKKGKLYRVAIPDFLLSGGDDMGYAMDRIPKSRVLQVGGTYMRDALVDKLARDGAVNSAESPLVKPEAPRVTYVNAKPPKPGRKKARRTRKHASAPPCVSHGILRT